MAQLIILKRRETFCASHRLYNPNLSDKKNKELYSKCSQHHGHNYALTISVSGGINKDSGMIIEFEEIKTVLSKIIKKVDHTHLNDLDEFINKPTTVENFAQIIWQWLENEFPENIKIEELELMETEKNTVILKNIK